LLVAEEGKGEGRDGTAALEVGESDCNLKSFPTREKGRETK